VKIDAMMALRTLAGTLSNRFGIANRVGTSFDGNRRIYTALGYKDVLSIADYRHRFDRDGVANRVVSAFPKEMWRGGAELIEEADPTKITPFEQAFLDFAKRVDLWAKFERADTLTGLGRYGVVLIGGPGPLDRKMPKCTIDKIRYVQPFAEDDATITNFVQDPKDERFGLPEFYSITRTSAPGALNITTRVHWSRVLHITDGELDDNVYGPPRLEKVWNRLDDLDKVVGGGSEAFWLRAHQGYHFNLDKDFRWPADPEEKAEAQSNMADEIDEFVHQVSRVVRSKGMEVNTLGSDVADFQPQADALLTLISLSTGIPKRILMGSERGELSSRRGPP
jgi:hypothetical protein